MFEFSGACGGSGLEEADEDCSTPPATPADCPACSRPYNPSSRRPKLLPCNHTVCKACILTRTKVMECPLCSAVVEVSDGGIQTDFVTLKAVCPPDISEDLQNSFQNSMCLSPTEEQTPDDKTSQTPNSGGDKVTPEGEDAAPGTRQHGAHRPGDPESTFQTSSQTNADMVRELLQGQFQEALESAQCKLATIHLQSELLSASRHTTHVRVDAEFDHLIQVINRRRQLIKNQVEDIYTELMESVQEDEERLSLNSMCLGSLKQHSRLIMKGDGERLQGAYHQVASEITELKENIDQVSMDAPVCIDFIIKDKLKDFERSVRTLGKVQTGANIPTSISITENLTKVGEESTLVLSARSAEGQDINPEQLDGMVRVDITDADDKVMDSHLYKGHASDSQITTFNMTFTPSISGKHNLKPHFCDKPLPPCNFEVYE